MEVIAPCEIALYFRNILSITDNKNLNYMNYNCKLCEKEAFSQKKTMLFNVLFPETFKQNLLYTQ